MKEGEYDPSLDTFWVDGFLVLKLQLDRQANIS